MGRSRWLIIWESPLFLGLLTRTRVYGLPRSEAALSSSPHSIMLLHVLVLAALTSRAECYFVEEKFPEESGMQPPTVVIAIIARNAAHSLPYYLGALERLNYPKDRISVWWVSCMLCSRLLSQGSASYTPSKGQKHLDELRKGAVLFPL